MAQNGWTMPSEEEYRAFASFSLDEVQSILCLYLLTERSMNEVAAAIFNGTKDSRTISQITRCLGFAGKNKYIDKGVTDGDIKDFVKLYYPVGYRNPDDAHFDKFISSRVEERKRVASLSMREQTAHEQMMRERRLREKEALMQERRREQAEMEEIEQRCREEAERIAKANEEHRIQELERIRNEVAEQTRVQKLAYEWNKITNFLNHNEKLNPLDEAGIIDSFNSLYNQNYNDAVFNYGWFYYNLSIKTSNPDYRFGYLSLSAKANYPIAMNNYGAEIEAGRFGLPANLDNALTWYMGAAELDNDFGRMNAGRLLFEKGEYEAARINLEKIRVRFTERWILVYWAKSVIRSSYNKSLTNNKLARDLYKEVLECLNITSDKDDKLYASLVLYYSAVFDFLECYRVDDLTGRADECKELFGRLEKASAYGSPLANMFLGDFYYFLNLPYLSIAKARRYYEAAMNDGNARAAYMLAKTFLTESLDSEKDVLLLMNKASALGSEEAKIWLSYKAPDKLPKIKLTNN